MCVRAPRRHQCATPRSSSRSNRSEASHSCALPLAPSPRVVRQLSWRGGLLVPARTAQPLSRPLKDAHTHATRGGAPPPAHAGGIHTIHTTVALSRPRRPEDDSRRARDTPTSSHLSLPARAGGEMVPGRATAALSSQQAHGRRPSSSSSSSPDGHALGPLPPPQTAMLWDHFLLLRRPCSGTGRRPRAS